MIDDCLIICWTIYARRNIESSTKVAIKYVIKYYRALHFLYKLLEYLYNINNK